MNKLINMDTILDPTWMIPEIWTHILSQCSYQDAINTIRVLYLLQKNTGIDYNVDKIVSIYLNDTIYSNTLNKYMYQLYLDLNTNIPIRSNWYPKKYMDTYTKIHDLVNEIYPYEFSKSKELLKVLKINLEKYENSNKQLSSKIFRNVTAYIPRKYNECRKCHEKHDNMCISCQNLQYWKILLKSIQ